MSAAAPPPQTLLVVGDSLSAEYGLQRGTGWVALLRSVSPSAGLPIKVVNASISGDTTAGGLARLPALLERHHPDLVVIELGGNDALRGLPLTTTRANLAAMARGGQGGRRARRDRRHAAAAQLRTRLRRALRRPLRRCRARRRSTALVPFLLKGVADGPQADSLFQADRIHPLAAAHPTILANVWPVLAPLLK